MTIDVRNGDVQVREVRAWENSRGVYTVIIDTPMERNVSIRFGDTVREKSWFDVYAAMKRDPSRISLAFDRPTEFLAFNGYRAFWSSRGLTEILAVPACLLDKRGGLVGTWRLLSARTDYLERLY